MERSYYFDVCVLVFRFPFWLEREEEKFSKTCQKCNVESFDKHVILILKWYTKTVHNENVEQYQQQQKLKRKFSSFSKQLNSSLPGAKFSRNFISNEHYLIYFLIFLISSFCCHHFCIIRIINVRNLFLTSFILIDQ